MVFAALPTPLLFPTSLTRRFRLDIIEWLPIAFLSPLPLPIVDDDDDTDTWLDDMDKVFLAVSMAGK